MFYQLDFSKIFLMACKIFNKVSVKIQLSKHFQNISIKIIQNSLAPSSIQNTTNNNNIDNFLIFTEKTEPNRFNKLNYNFFPTSPYLHILYMRCHVQIKMSNSRAPLSCTHHIIKSIPKIIKKCFENEKLSVSFSIFSLFYFFFTFFIFRWHFWMHCVRALFSFMCWKLLFWS